MAKSRKEIDKLLKTAEYKNFSDSTVFGSIPEVVGVWANTKTQGACKQERIRILLRTFVGKKLLFFGSGQLSRLFQVFQNQGSKP